MADPLSPEAEDLAHRIEPQLRTGHRIEQEQRDGAGGHYYIRVDVPRGHVRPVQARVVKEVPVEREGAEGGA